MKIAVPLKRIPDPYTPLSIASDGTLSSAIPGEELAYVVNPFDEVALEAALQLFEHPGTQEDSVIAIAVGPDPCEKLLRAALAMGTQEAILVETDDQPGPAVAAAMIAVVCRQEQVNLIIAGKQGADLDQQQTPLRVAALLGWPCVSNAISMDFDSGGELLIGRIASGGTETVRVSLPAVVTVDLQMAEPRFVGLPAIVRARSKPLKRIQPHVPSVTPQEPQILGIRPAPRREACVMLDSVEALAEQVRKAGGM